MISRLIELEQQRLTAMGYDTVVSPVSVNVSSARKIVNLGNDTYILTGIRMSRAAAVSDDYNVSLSSPTEGIQGTEQQIAQMGQAVYKLFRGHIIIKTTKGDDFDASASIPQYTLDFMKVTPKIKK